MKKQVFIITIILLAFVDTIFAQKMTVKDNDSHILMEVEDEGTVGSIMIPDSTEAPETTTNKLYNKSGALYWNGLKTILYIGYSYTFTSTSNSTDTWMNTSISFAFTLPSDKMVNFRASGTVWASGTTDIAAFRFTVDGTPYVDSTTGDRLVSCGQVYSTWYLERPISLTSGTHVAQVQFRRASGSGTVTVGPNSTMSQMFVEAF